MRHSLLILAILGLGCDAAPAPPVAASATATASAPAPHGTVALFVDEKPVGALHAPGPGESIDIAKSAAALPPYEKWYQVSLVSPGGRMTSVQHPKKSYPGARPMLRRDKSGRLWFNLNTKAATGPSGADITEIFVATRAPEKKKRPPLALVVDGKDTSMAWSEIEGLDRVDGKRRQSGWSLLDVLSKRKVTVEDDTAILVEGRKGRLALRGRDLRDEAAFVVVTIGKRNTFDVSLWRPIDAKDPARRVRGVTRVIVGGEAAAVAESALSLTIGGKPAKALTLGDIRGLPEAASGSRRTGYTLVSALEAREVKLDAIASVTVQAGEKQMVIEGDALRADPGDVVVRIGREEELQLRLAKSKGRLDGLTAISVALKP